MSSTHPDRTAALKAEIKDAKSSPQASPSSIAAEKQKQKQTKPSFCDTHEFVTFLVGCAPAQKKFLVHKQFACHYSPVLKAAFNSNFEEGQTQTYRFEDSTADIFAMFVQWIYTQKLEYDLNESAPGTISKRLIRLWILAEKLLIPRLQNLAIDGLEDIRKATRSIYTSEMPFVYENTAAESPLRRLLVSHCAYMSVEAFANSGHPIYPAEMLFDLAVTCKIIFRQQLSSTLHRDMADYHVPEGDTNAQ